MSHFSSRRGGYGASAGSTINQKAALASAYQELGKELSSVKLKAVGNYTLQRTIGEGTYGKVRLGLHRLTNTRVAIKQVPKAHSASLTREIHHHRRLHHPNVMKLYEVIATEQYIWMVSELCPGGELYDYLVEREYLPEAEGRRVFGQLCLAVAYIHGKGIVHRDLKLENVLLDERCNVKLGDFGFTREFEGKKLMDTFCGTTGYAAPEMLAGKRYTGEEVDIWSLGIILYALLCGALPFDDDDEAVMKAKILKGEYELPEVLSAEAKDLITAILQLDPLKRPTIQAILSHAWFSKVIVSTPMSTLAEDEAVNGYFEATHGGGDAGAKADAGASPRSGEAVKAVPEPRPLLDVEAPGVERRSSSASPSDIGQDRSPPHSPMSDLPDGRGHGASVSGTSESSFYSARSDSESSDRRSSTTDITDPTTTESHIKDTGDTGKDAQTLSVHDATRRLAEQAPGRTKLPRNESQSTITRAGSNGSDASHGASGLRPSARPGSNSLPTHHELPHAYDHDSGEDTPVALHAVSLTKRGSQGSSRGHHRTPSRTKRRSVSSGGLADHHPPLVGSRPIDYVAQLTHPQPAMFCTALEQNLLHQLSGLGVDVGQLVHSICTDACDASGALWWMLLRKAHERAPTVPALSVPLTPPAPKTSSAAIPAAAATAPRAVDPSSPSPPPLPQKDPSRWSQDRGARYSLTASKSMDSSLFEATSSRLHTVISQEEIGSGRQGGPSLSSPTDPQDEARPRASTSIPASASLNALPLVLPDAPRTPTDAVTTPTSKERPKHRHHPTTPSSFGSARAQTPDDSAPASPVGTPKSRRSHQTDRARSNSLSMKQFASTMLGTREKSPPQPEQVWVAGENLPLERSKSPGIFGKRTISSSGTKESPSIASKLASTSTPSKKASTDVASPEKARKSMSSRRTAEVDAVQRIKGAEAHEAGGRSPGGRSTEESKATPSASVESFSTTSLTPQSSEKGSKQKPGSSFMATVRTWLGANEKPSSRKQQKAGKKASKAGTSSLGYDGPASASQYANRPASVRKRAGPYHHNAQIARRPSKPSGMGSLSRRSSTGSTKHFQPDFATPSHSQYGRPGTLRRLSAGSITPTATLYGDYMQEHVPTHGRTPSRSSRPSSGHSQHLSGLQGRKGSASSGSSAFRMQGGSTYSSSSGRRHAHHRLSHDGGTVVRRHRAYNSSNGSPNPSRRNSRHETSRPGSLRSRNSSPGRTPLEGAVEELDDFGRPMQRSGISTPRRSLESGSRRPSSLRHESHSGRQSPMSTGTGGRGSGHAHHHSVFVAHKSRTPYKPPSANPALHGSHSRHHSASAASSSSLFGAGPSNAPGQPPAAGTGTWRYSWGRPPPSWAGSVDPPPPASQVSGAAQDRGDGAPKLRDVFANRDAADDDWTDEDDDQPAYSGGLGQLDSLSGGGGGAGAWSSSDYRNEGVKGSPYATRALRDFAGAGGSGGGGAASGAGWPERSSSRGGGGGGGPPSMLGYGRYAGVRSLFTPPSLGNDFSPKTLSTTLSPDLDAGASGLGRRSVDGVASSSMGTEGTKVDGSGSEPGSAVASPTLANVAVASTSAVQQQQQQQQTAPSGVVGAASGRIRAGSTAANLSAFKGIHIVEEEEEDE